MTIKEELKGKTLVEILDLKQEKSKQCHLKKNRRWVKAATNYLQKRYYPAEVPMTKKELDRMMSDKLNGTDRKPAFSLKKCSDKSQEEIDAIFQRMMDEREGEMVEAMVVSTEIM